MKEIRLSRSGYFPPGARFFGGGGRTAAAPAPLIIPSAPVEPVAPAPTIANAPITPVAPPATATSAEVIQAQQDQRRDALKKKGFAGTVKAGDTKGWQGGGGWSASGTKPVGGGMGSKLGTP